MSKMKELAGLVKELEGQLVICIRCGMCQSVCPLFEQTRKEADVARGKLALLNGLMENIFSDPDGVNQRLNRCLLCGSCAANCPSGVNVLEIFIKARAILAEYKGLSPVKKLIFRKMLAHPETFDNITAWAGKFQGLFARETGSAQGTSCARIVSPLLANRHFLPLARTPFHKSMGRISTRGAGPRAAMFTGCLVDKIFPGIGHAALEVFSHHKTGIVIPAGQGCCGIPALASGDRKTFTKLVDHNLTLFKKEKFDVLITACATCTSTIKKLWPAIYKDADSGIRNQLENLSQKTMDINQFLVEMAAPHLADGKGKTQQSKTREIVTYHDPCHLKKSLGISEQPRTVIRASGKNLVEMAGSDKCCGMGGSFNAYHYNLSTAIGNLKAKGIKDTGCTTLTTGCPACMMQISDILAKEKIPIGVKHPIELYAQALKGE